VIKNIKQLKTVRLAVALMVTGLAAPWAHGAASGIYFKTLEAFDYTNTWANSGASPFAPPVLAADGNLYGVLPYGGTNNAGVLYKVGTNGVETTLHTFDTHDGAAPSAQLTVGPDGKLYGVAAGGGTNNVGAVFAITTNGTFSLLYSFGMTTNNLGYSLDGANPYGGMIVGRDGNFYGTTYSGGTSNAGTVFQFWTNGTLNVLHSFIGTGSNDDGAQPLSAPLVEVADGVFYGTTTIGGTNNAGTIFRITADGTLTTLFEFNKTNGLNPYAGLCYGMNGLLYGTTLEGGTNNYGSVFQITTNGVLKTLFSFGPASGVFPDDGLAMGIHNVLYGTTYSAGANNYGTLFQLTTNGQLTTLFTFTNGTDGGHPYAGVTRDAAGNLFGACNSGGTNGGYGTIYQWSDRTRPTNSITVPAAGQRWSNVVFTASGKAGDNVGVADVFYSLNGSAWAEAGTSNNGTAWTAPVSLIPGTNSLQSYSMDYSGNLSTTSSVSFDFVVTNQLKLNLLGLGTIKPNYSNAWLEIGRNYSITSAPAAGFVFTNWLVSTNGFAGGALVTGTNLHFTMSSNLSLQASFLDVARPGLTITAPTLGQKMTNALATVFGKATDNWHVSNVWYQLNGGTWSLATTTNGYTNWSSALLPLISGTNKVNAYALDSSGNASITTNVSFVSSNTFKLLMSFSQSQPLTTTGLDLNLQISPGLNGHIQVSTNLQTWSAFTNFLGSNTNLNLRDPAATNFSRRFYRAVIP
jgi:uncharacterized repeat protein (TIGR03803 family)